MSSNFGNAPSHVCNCGLYLFVLVLLSLVADLRLVITTIPFASVFPPRLFARLLRVVFCVFGRVQFPRRALLLLHHVLRSHVRVSDESLTPSFHHLQPDTLVRQKVRHDGHQRSHEAYLIVDTRLSNVVTHPVLIDELQLSPLLFAEIIGLLKNITVHNAYRANTWQIDTVYYLSFR